MRVGRSSFSSKPTESGSLSKIPPEKETEESPSSLTKEEASSKDGVFEKERNLPEADLPATETLSTMGTTLAQIGVGHHP